MPCKSLYDDKALLRRASQIFSANPVSVLSYDRILSFVDEMAQVVKVLFSHSDNKVLPSTLRQGIFTIFVDYNLDKNSSSVDAKDHFHETGVTVIQFPTVQTAGFV